MSRITILKSIFTVSLGAFIGYAAVDYFKNRNSSHRYLASVTMSKMASEQFSKTLLDVRIKNVDVGINADDPSVIKVSLSAFKPIPAGLVFNWNLPNDIQILEGQPTGTLKEFSANETVDLVLKVKGYNKTKKNFLSFTITGDIENTKFQREVLASSRPEDSFEYVVQEYEKSKANDAKVNGKVGKLDYKAPIDLKKVIH